MAGALLCIAAAAPRASAAPAQASPAGAAQVPIVLVTEPGTSARTVVHAVGGEVTRSLPIVHGVAAKVPVRALAGLRARDGVRAAVRDRRLHPSADTAVAPDAGLTLGQVRTIMGADQGAGAGAGVDVALVDTGIAPVPGLAEPGKVVNAPDFSADAKVPAQASLDAFGHGTHMAGIINAGEAGTGSTGVAPGARVVNVRVGDHTGDTSLSRMLAGIDWAVRNRQRDGLNIRVLNLAFGGQVDGSYRNDPLAFAVEQAWQRGIVVVTAAGNGGADVSGLDSPAYDPYVVAVGAQDTVGTPETPGDDVVADFSSVGAADRGADVLAPGVGIVSLRVPGGLLDDAFPAARIGDRGFRGSGTSQASAAVSGAAALLLSHRPELAPDEVKALLRTTARPLAGQNPLAQGAGVVDVAAAETAAIPAGATQRWPRARFGGQWRARAGAGLEMAVESSSRRWSADDWSSRRWSSRRWSGDDWSSRRWSGDDWSSRRWSGDDWSSRRWSGLSW